MNVDASAANDDFNRQLIEFLGEATTPFHAVQAMVRRLDAAGFQPLEEDGDWSRPVDPSRVRGFMEAVEKARG